MESAALVAGSGDEDAEDSDGSDNASSGDGCRVSPLLAAALGLRPGALLWVSTPGLLPTAVRVELAGPFELPGAGARAAAAVCMPLVPAGGLGDFFGGCTRAASRSASPLRRPTPPPAA